MARVWISGARGPAPSAYHASGEPVPGVAVSEVPLPPAVRAARAAWPRRVYHLAGLPPDADLVLASGADRGRIRTLPGPRAELRILLASCFALDTDGGALWAGVRRLRAADRPHLRILCGDQIYMDVPGFPYRGGSAPEAAARDTRARTLAYWTDPGYGAFLADGLTLFAPDDHEWWNDFPHPQIHLGRTWTGGSRHAWTEAGTAAFLAHQALANPDGATWFDLDLGPVSLFVADLRTRRTRADVPPEPRLMDDAQAAALAGWSRTLAKPGLLVLSQPLFQEPRAKAFGRTTDHNILAYPADAARIWNAVETAAHDVAVLAGDIHMGRAARWITPRGRELHEVVSSPMSLIRTDRVELALGLRRARPAPGNLRPFSAAAPARSARTVYTTTRNHVTLLRLAPRGGAVDVRASVIAVPEAATPLSETGAPVPCRDAFTLS